MKKSSPKQQPQLPPMPFKHAEEFVSLYANNVQIEQSVWDLKLVFGQLDQSQPSVFVEQHTAMTIPWIQAKLLSYFIDLHLEAYESVNGKIRVPTEVLPPEPVPPTDEQMTSPYAQALYELIKRRREEWIASLGQ